MRSPSFLLDPCCELTSSLTSTDPDKNDSEEAKIKFLEVSRAYEVLSDPEKRKTYERYGEDGLKQQEGGGGHGNDPFAMFRSQFGFGQQGVRRGQNMLAEIEVDLKSMYEGDSMKVRFSLLFLSFSPSEQAELTSYSFVLSSPSAAKLSASNVTVRHLPLALPAVRADPFAL